MANVTFYITEKKIHEFRLYLKNEERADNTIEKYTRDIRQFVGFLNGEPVTKDAAVAWKIKLKQTHAVTSINSMLAALNSFCAFFSLGIKIKPYRIQRQLFLSDRKDLSRAEYERLLQEAKSQTNERLFYIIQTICATGIRVSELKYITSETVKAGQAEITNKGKTRAVFIAKILQKTLSAYAKKHKITSGCIFITRNGKPLNRSNIWSDMKKLCEDAEVEPAKVFSHNLRRLFSRMFYSHDKDLAKLADTLGHSSVDTTRIYIMESNAKHRQIIERLGLTRLHYT